MSSVGNIMQVEVRLLFQSHRPHTVKPGETRKTLTEGEFVKSPNIGSVFLRLLSHPAGFHLRVFLLQDDAETTPHSGGPGQDPLFTLSGGKNFFPHH